ncbi:hypothetical protein [Synechococcus sp. F70.1]|jgi:hypothetical protein|uniref:hypothetical protein n=1 Tax=Synechococcus sp. F70.1 TaxID=2964532 RepID=UPI0039C61EA0
MRAGLDTPRAHCLGTELFLGTDSHPPAGLHRYFLFGNTPRASNANVLTEVGLTLLLLVPRLHQVRLLGSLFGVSGSLLGMYASYSLNTAT